MSVGAIAMAMASVVRLSGAMEGMLSRTKRRNGPVSRGGKQ